MKFTNTALVPITRLPSDPPRPSRNSWCTASAILLSSWALSCGGDPIDTASGELPPDTAAPGFEETTTEPWFPSDTYGFDSGLDISPPNELAAYHIGEWSMSPVGGPYTTVIGELIVEELIDDNPNTPLCQARFSITGDVISETCDTCELGVELRYYLVEEGIWNEDDGVYETDDDGKYVGRLEDCHTTDLPEDNEVRQYGFSSLEETIYFNYFDSAIWVPWYDATSLHDDVYYEWSGAFGYYPDDDDD